MQLISENKFDFFITVDKNLRHQQNLSRFDFSIILLSAKDNKHQTLQPYIPLVQTLLKEKKYTKFNEILLD